MTIGRFTRRYWLILLCCLFVGRGTAQIDTLFKYGPNERLFRLWIIGETEFFKLNDSVSTFQKLDTVITVARQKGDKRMDWYAQYFKHIYNARKWHDLKKEIVEMRNMDNWVSSCPLEEIHASYQHILGHLLFIDLQFTEAFDLLLKAQRSFEKIGYENIPEVGQYLYELGADYYVFEDYEKALAYLKLAEAHPSYILRMNINNTNTQGLIYQQQKEYALARQKFLQTIDTAKKYKDSVWIGIASGNYGNTLSLEGNYAQAIDHLLVDYQTNQAAEPYNTAITCLYLANCYTHTGDATKASFFFDRGLQLEAGKADPNFYRHFYRMKAGYFASSGDYAAAFRYSDSAIKFSDSMKATFNNQILASAEKRITAETIETKAKLAEEQERSHALQRNLIIIAAAAGVCILLLLLYQKNKTLQRDKELISQKQELLKVEKAMMEEKLKSAEVQLNDYIRNISEKNDLIEKISNELQSQQAGAQTKSADKLQRLNELMQFTILTEDDWKNFKQLFDTVHPNFLAAVKDRLPALTPAETRLLSLLKLHLSHREMSSMLGVSSDTITKSKYRLRKKIAELNVDKELEELVEEL